jgi:hypothetical protein
VSVEVDYFYSDELFQANEVQGWFWPVGFPADGRYWSLAVVPELANLAVCQLLDYWWATDNSDQFHLTAFFDVKGDRQHLDDNLNPDYTLPGDILFGVKLIRAPSV